ncbi:MerR family transcriptional regulator [Pseudonocardia sp.]|uniref:DNA polymerase III subunit beta family protein n=1 Tax=Pseudonocardia sp. TaxID=60912 RepID=UPI0026102A73|nr:MerR family transcriptional regulator [Pseudonocardia sp.]
MESWRGIGRMARESGLTVSALRFYDGAGVFGPAHVDPHSGYRFYAPDQLVVARLVASLRRVGMPLAGIREVLEHRHDPDAVDALLDGHLRRLEQGVADARRELSSVRTLLTAPEETPVSTTVTLPAADLAAALRAVRFAVGSDPTYPALRGVLLDVTADVVTLVATDRYRLAVSTVRRGAAPAVAALLPARFADQLAGFDAGDVLLRIDGSAVSARCGAATVQDRLLDNAFPDFRRLVPAAGNQVPVDATELRTAVAAAGTRQVRREQDGVDVDVTVLSVDADGRLHVGTGPEGTGVSVEFLLEAVDAGGAGQLRLELDGPLAPVTIRPSGRPGTYSLLMPVRL